jgi:DNA-binding PucR family transcriptional regulator
MPPHKPTPSAPDPAPAEVTSPETEAAPTTGPDLETTRAAVVAGSDMVRALLVERAGYLRGGKADRVAQVDEQLRRRGYPTDGLPSAGDEPQAPDAPPRGRRAASKSTAAEKSDDSDGKA